METSAPEILKRISQGRSVTFNQATDIYSVGATLRELLMGEDFILRENSISGAVDYSNPKILIQQSRITSIGDYPAIKKLLKQMTSDNPKKRPSLVHAIEQFEQALGLEPGTSIAQLKAQLTESNSSQPTSIVSDTKAMVSPKQIHSNDKKYDSRKTLTDIQVQQALNQYQREKNGLLRTGIRWYYTSTATLKAAAELTHHKKHLFLFETDLKLAALECL